MDGGVGGEERIANQARLLLGYDNRIGGIEEACKGGRSGGGPRCGPRRSEIEGCGGFSIEECLKLREEGQGDVGGFSCDGGREIDGLDACRVFTVEWKIGIEGDPGGFPDNRITAPMRVSFTKPFILRRIERETNKKPAVSSSGAKGMVPANETRLCVGLFPKRP